MDIKKRKGFLKRQLNKVVLHMEKLLVREHIDKVLDWKLVIEERELENDQKSLYTFDDEKKIHTIIIDSNLLTEYMENKWKLFDIISEEMVHAFLQEVCVILDDKEDSLLREAITDKKNFIYICVWEHFNYVPDIIDMFFSMFFSEYDPEVEKYEKQKEDIVQTVFKLKRCSREITNKKTK